MPGRAYFELIFSIHIVGVRTKEREDDNNFFVSILRKMYFILFTFSRAYFLARQCSTIKEY